MGRSCARRRAHGATTCTGRAAMTCRLDDYRESFFPFPWLSTTAAHTHVAAPRSPNSPSSLYQTVPLSKLPLLLPAGELIESTSISEYWCTSGVAEASSSSRDRPIIREGFEVFASVSLQKAMLDVSYRHRSSSIVSLLSRIIVERADFNCGWDNPTLTSLLKRRL